MATAAKVNQAADYPVSVVVVDDEPMILRSLCHMLGQSPYQILPCINPHQAINHICDGNVQAVISDVSMPEMSGIELLRTIREHDPDLPVILVTGVPQHGTAADAIEFGAFKYLVKPVEPGLLMQTVERAVRLYRLAQAKRQALSLFGDPTLEAERASLEAAFARAINRMWMAFQPIVRASDHTIYGYEALLRSHEHSMAGPEPLLQAAERLGTLNRLGRSVRKHTARAISTAPPECTFFVNLHPQDLLDPDLHDGRSALTSMADNVVLEITERAAIPDVENARSCVLRLRDSGFRIAVDDLGAGYAGLSSFALLEPEFVKLDMSLIRDVDRSPIKQRLVKSITTLCQDMGLHVIAEGIETYAERDAVVELGCDLLQGFLFARPGPGFSDVTW